MDHKVTRRDVAKPTGAPLPTARAFVVQLRAETEPAGEIFVGRAEHMASGTTERFGSAAELLDFIARTLACDDDAHPALGARGPGAIAEKETR
jgi:hypothetical protein